VGKILEKSLTIFRWPLKTCNDGDDVTCQQSMGTAGRSGSRHKQLKSAMHGLVVSSFDCGMRDPRVELALQSFYVSHKNHV